ncbi:ABC transporter ATP-binding protein [Desulfosporosinus sp. OT]|uniref:ABC transporter ATP-binding protein n=1 Tax=Desulfosporosinus sp. OT TaxID=913865 RepID=UPI000223A026|nr:ABC transporter ATP-binding protein [Desulfosporosinus sp. OT]EGW37989.1 oligopeptide/dipeptide ABC transporter, ATP-binding, C-terminal domain protein [Desulfosporosinus sp. OT]
MEKTLLKVQDLAVEFRTRHGPVRAADRISFEVKPQETFCLVGESGCGKSVVALAILGLLPANALVNGGVWYRGSNLLPYSTPEQKLVRGREIAMIFEQPMGCLNPVMSIGEQIMEAYGVNNECSKQEARRGAKRLIEEVGISARRIRDYPHELSGGMQQRVMIAMALACQPSLLIADEPTTSLDVTVQYQIIQLLRDLKTRYAMSLLLITHDLGVVAEMGDRVAVMYAGNLLEITNVHDFFFTPGHPYSRALIKVVEGNSLNPIQGNVPSLTDQLPGCPFYARCPEAISLCGEIRPRASYLNNKMERCHLVQFDASRKAN